MIKYFDSSVLLQIILNLGDRAFLSEISQRGNFTSRLSQVEVLRTVMKIKPELIEVAIDLLMELQFIEITSRVIDNASSYPQEISLKSSDAIHMATAELLLDVDDVLVTFDKQMALNAERLGIKVLTSF